MGREMQTGDAGKADVTGREDGESTRPTSSDQTHAPETVTRCSVCARPAHASETDEDWRCSACRETWIVEHAVRSGLGSLTWHRYDADEESCERPSLDAAIEAVASSHDAYYRVVRRDESGERVVWEGEPEAATRWLNEQGAKSWAGGAL